MLTAETTNVLRSHFPLLHVASWPIRHFWPAQVSAHLHLFHLISRSRYLYTLFAPSSFSDPHTRLVFSFSPSLTDQTPNMSTSAFVTLIWELRLSNNTVMDVMPAKTATDKIFKQRRFGGILIVPKASSLRSRHYLSNENQPREGLAWSGLEKIRIRPTRATSPRFSFSSWAAYYKSSHSEQNVKKDV